MGDAVSMNKQERYKGRMHSQLIRVVDEELQYRQQL
jgi:hypothetical protein